MCGIAGIVRKEGGPALERDIAAMTSAVAHRGPDGEGRWTGELAAIGHRRLSIIDPQGGLQPMWDAKKRKAITYNGEVYNFRELRAELEQKGHVFATRCDTEVVLHTYLEWGHACVTRLRGMFAFGIVDLDRREVFVARDHFGIKPLYYRVEDDFVAFASELNALRSVGPTPAASLAAVDLYLRYQYIPAPTTIYRGVYKLPPASSMVIGFDGKVTGPTRYWDFRFEPDESVSLEGWVDRFVGAVRESVQAHLVADVPFGVFLSGGIDSSLVAGTMREILGPGVLGFSIGFDEARVSELSFAKEAADRWSFELVTDVMKSDAVAELPRMAAQYGEPFGDSSILPTWQVSRLARGRVPMVLSGDGGDEGFAGYDSYLAWTSSQLRPYFGRLKQHPGVGAAVHLVSALCRRGLGRDLNAEADWERIIGFFPEPMRRRFFREEHAGVVGRRAEAFARAAAAAETWDRLDFAQYVDYQTYLPDDILTKVDVASMAHGLEVRTPLIDLRVLDLARRIPPALRLEQLGSRAVGKQIPRRALQRWFSPDFVNRKKQGFGIPRVEWLRQGGGARVLFDKVLASGALGDVFREEPIRELLRDHDEGRPRDGFLWLLLIFGLWRDANPGVRFTS